jgi:glycosyltransferase involved in cell wall biosynthesis
MRFSVIITTYNRADVLPRAVGSVLSQQAADVELIVVNDGSSDETRSFLDGLADPRVVVVHQENGGLGAARNSGIAHASTEWVVFLDDDDTPLPNWLSGLGEMVGTEVGAVCCAAEYRTPSGDYVATAGPGRMGPLFRNQLGNTLAGTFAVRIDLIRAIGGYDERMTCSHQSELWLRLVPKLIDGGLTVRSTNQVLIHLERRGPHERPLSSPEALYLGTRLLLDKHRDTYARHRASRASSFGVLGVSAARLGKWPEARSALLASARAEPLSPRRWLRLGTVIVPALASRVWRTADYERQVPL